MNEAPRSAIAVQTLMLLIAGFWLVFAMISALGGLPGQLSAGPVRWLMAILASGAVFVLVFLAYQLKRQKNWAFYASLLALTGISVLSISDEIGFWDWFSLIISLAAIVLLLLSSAWYLGQPPGDSTESHE